MISIRYFLQARFAEAQQWLDRMRNPSPSMLTLRAIAIFGQGRIDEAFNEYRKSLNAAQANSAIDISIYMLGDSATLFHPDKDNLRLLFNKGVELKIKDSSLFCSLRHYMILFGPVSIDQIFDGVDVPYKKYPFSLTLPRVLSLIEAVETAQKQSDEAQLESLTGEMKKISQRLARRRPKDPLDKIVLSALLSFIVHLFEDAECDASVYSELISETETHIMQLSEDIDRVKALAILD